ncbi:hypothetical protein HYR54_00920 [Candidatus Acetothermia bacterium]|nr:hypothetical protein [Candidatus Acetothermia bacterium]
MKTTYAGLDLSSGKRHPSHLSVLERDKDGVFWQLESQWWDHKPVTEVVSEAIGLCESHQVQCLLYDSTRGELQVLEERGELPYTWQGVPFTLETKIRLAARLAIALTKKELRLLPDARQQRQLLLVDQLLNAPETAEGHSDCFWSLALALESTYEPPSALDLIAMDLDELDWRDLEDEALIWF